MPALFRTLAAAPLALVVTLLTAAPAQASAIYTYTGNNFTLFTFQGPSTPADPYTTADRVTVVMEMAAPLAANLSALTTVTPLAFAFTDGINTITNATATDSLFMVETDGSGRISSWLMVGSIFAPRTMAAPRSTSRPTTTWVSSAPAPPTSLKTGCVAPRRPSTPGAPCPATPSTPKKPLAGTRRACGSRRCPSRRRRC